MNINKTNVRCVRSFHLFLYILKTQCIRLLKFRIRYTFCPKSSRKDNDIMQSSCKKHALFFVCDDIQTMSPHIATWKSFLRFSIYNVTFCFFDLCRQARAQNTQLFRRMLAMYYCIKVISVCRSRICHSFNDYMRS